MSVDNLRKTLALADSIDYREGRLSYIRYHRLMSSIASYYGFTLGEATAVFCSLSPNNNYMGNLRSMVSVLKGINEGIEPDLIIVSTYNECKNRAIRFLEGTNFEKHYRGRSTGKKILSFYLNIINPLDPHPVTIDGHAYSIYEGKRMTMKQAVRTKFSYNEIADAYRTLAKETGLIPNQLQGILWLTWKRIHNVVFKRQLNLMNQSDQWGLTLNPEQIKPFPFKQKSSQESKDSNYSEQEFKGIPLNNSSSQIQLFR
jgi:hypothetical protein